MDRVEHSERWWQYVLFSLGIVIIATLACNGDVDPGRPELQPPTVNIGLRLEDFLKWIGLFPKHVVPPPWIVEPLTAYYTEQDSFRVRGWAVNSADRPGVPNTRPIVTLYEVDYPVNPSEVRELGQTEVGDDREWVIDNVPMQGNRLVIAANVSIVMPGEVRRYSDFSNTIVIHRGQPPKPSIEWPENGFETTEETVTVRGKAQAGYNVVLFRNDIEVGKSGADKYSTWAVENLSLLVGDNRLVARIEGTNVQSDVVLVKRTVPQPSFKFPWTEGETRYWTGGPHARSSWSNCINVPLDSVSALDFGEGGWKVRAAAPGKVVQAGWIGKAIGNGVVIDRGDGWSTLYAHLREIDPKIKEMVRDQKSIEGGTYLGISGCSGSGAKQKKKVNGEEKTICVPHLHFELLRNGSPDTWDGRTIDGWTVHAVAVKDQDNKAYNYEGTMMRGEENTEENDWCGKNKDKAQVTTGDQTRVADRAHKPCDKEDPSRNNDLSSSCNALVSTNSPPEAEE